MADFLEGINVFIIRVRFIEILKTAWHKEINKMIKLSWTNFQ